MAAKPPFLASHFEILVIPAIFFIALPFLEGISMRENGDLPQRGDVILFMLCCSTKVTHHMFDFFASYPLILSDIRICDL